MYELSPFQFSYDVNGNSKTLFMNSPLIFNANDSILITGASGSGKSTLLKILKGLIPEFGSGKLEGEILFKGKKLYGEHFSQNLKSILYLFQNPFSQIIYPETEEEFFFSMENMNFSLSQMDQQKCYFENRFNLKPLWGKKTNKLSNGECQRLVFSSLLAIGPEVLLLDEPTAFIDPSARKDFYELLKFSRKDKLLIIVDHHVQEVLPLVNRIIEVRDNGEIHEVSKDEWAQGPNSFLPEISFDWNQIRSNPSTLEIIDLSFSYDTDQLLSSLSASFHSGQIIVIKGENGVGKSTLFKLLAGILKPSKGSVNLLSEQRKFTSQNISNEVGFVFQNPETHFFFDTIEEELNFSLKLIESPAQRKEILEVFFSSLDLKKTPFLLSEGEKRRLSILITVFARKSLYLYDEPTFGQDERSKRLIGSLLKSIKEQGAIQIVISHDENFIQNVADRIFLLKEGHLVES